MCGRPALEASANVMWALVERYTGHVGYHSGTKAPGLDLDPPVIDCSGWVALLLTAGMNAANQRANRALFSNEDIEALHTWSDRMIEELEVRFTQVLGGDQINLGSLPSYATVGLRQGNGDWAKNHPRPRGITHVVQIVRRPRDGARFISESQGWAEPCGVRLLPLTEWLEVTREFIKPGEAWAVNAFAKLEGQATHN
ncbi:MAG: hypothetical protein JO105_14780 [Hyphomicrobiales bacterium]|nr:hypothetical protein [Hyphomicrobiales bacterium]